MKEEELTPSDWVRLHYEQHELYNERYNMNPMPLHYWSRQAFADNYTSKIGEFYYFLN